MRPSVGKCGALISISDVDINDNVLYRSQAHYQTVALRKPTVAARQRFDCLFAAASITVRCRPINQTATLTHNGNYLYYSGHFLLAAAGSVQLLQFLWPRRRISMNRRNFSAAAVAEMAPGRQIGKSYYRFSAALS